MAAEVMARNDISVIVYDGMPSAARKLLMAGRGGLNLTHSEPLSAFIARYGDAAAHLSPAIDAFPPAALRAWSDALGQPTFVGSSGRVFPKAFKASPLLREWLRRLASSGVRFAMGHRWRGWDDNRRLMFDSPGGPTSIGADATVLALGGASWPRLGANGAWVEILGSEGVDISPLVAANCGFTVAWSDIFCGRFAGQPLKNVELSFGSQKVRGEAVITRTGIEGGAVYALAATLRDAIAASGHATLSIALRPDIGPERLAARLSAPRGTQSFSGFLRKAAGLAPVGIGLLNETAITTRTKLSAMSPADLAALINAVPISLAGIAPLERAISTAGGIRFEELDEHNMLRRLPGVFAAGEMLDWEAPTGGYLLQACFATGAAAGRGVVHWLDR